MAVTNPIIGQTEVDTLYYDKEWKVVGNKVFAEYYRVYPVIDDSVSRKPFRDYYITGELQSEGGFITIDRYDDSKSVFDGDWTSYYKSGKIEQRVLVRGASKRVNISDTQRMVWYCSMQI